MGKDKSECCGNCQFLYRMPTFCGNPDSKNFLQSVGESEWCVHWRVADGE